MSRRALGSAAALAMILLVGCGRGSTPAGDDGAGSRPADDPAVIARNNAGVGRMGEFDFTAAQAIFEELAADHPEWSTARINQAIATLNQSEEGRQEEALALLTAVLEREPENRHAQYCAGLVDLFLGYPDRALPLFQAVATAHPDDAYAAYYTGQCHDYAGDFAAAREWYERASTLDPYLRSAYLGLHRVLQRLDRPGEAEVALETFRRLADNPRASLAEFKYTRMGRMGEAIVVGTPSPLPEPDGAALLDPVPLLDGPEPSWRTVGDEAVSLTFCDLDDDGRLDCFVPGVVAGNTPNLVALGTAGGGFAVDAAHPLAAVADVRAALWGDVDNDGRVDAYLCRDGVNALWLQTDAGRWEAAPASSGAGGGEHDTVDGVLADLDHDGDLDVYAVRRDGPNELLINNLDGTFRSIAAEAGVAGPAGGSRMALAVDLDQDRDLDLVVLGRNGSNAAYRNDRLWRYDAFAEGDLGGFLTTAGESMAVGDLDGDGAVELAVATAAGAVRVFRRGVDGAWQGRDEVEGLAALRAIEVADLTGSGGDAIVGSADGAGPLPGLDADERLAGWALAMLDVRQGPSIVGWTDTRGPLRWGPGPGRYPFAGLRFRGRDDPGQSMRSNASGIGVHFQARVGARWSGGSTLRRGGGPGQSLQPVTVGLGEASQVDFVSLDWPDGVFQGEGPIPAGGPTTVVETQRQISSCPVLFAWNGARFEFVSDLLGVGGMGYLLEPGQYAPPRPWEHFLLPDELAVPRDGSYVFKLTEPMEEACYLDAATLHVIDLPPGWSMALDERMAINGPEATGAPIYFRSGQTPRTVIDGGGVDRRSAVVEVDGVAAPVGDLDARFIGRLREELILAMEFAAPLDQPAGYGLDDDAVGRPVLMLDGWVEYPYSQTNFAAWQAGATYEPPTLEARGADGRWVVVLPQFGYPAGMPRRMTMPLEDLPEGTDALRLRTTMEVYLDRIVVVWAEPVAGVPGAPEPLKPSAALLSEVGFPHRIDHPQRRPEYDYDRRTPFWDVRHQSGWYTAFGDVRPLVEHADDAVAIFGPGEEIELRFDATSLPALRDGWSRRLVLETRGWCKDMDLFTRDGETVGPLPTRGAEPAPERDELHRRFNTRWDGGR